MRFTGICTLTHSGNLVLPGAANITTAANDVIAFRCVGSGQWIMTTQYRPMAATLQGVSAFALTLLDDADAAAARTTLGAQASLGFTPVNLAGGVGARMTGTLGIVSNGTGAVIDFRDSINSVSRFYSAHSNTGWSLNSLDDSQAFLA